MTSLKRLTIFAPLAVSTLAFTSCGSPTPPRRTTPVRTTYVYRPSVTIRNNSYKNIVIGVKGPETRFISIPARSSRRVNLRSGSYKYAAAAKGIKTISGYKYFGTNRSYTWNFNIN